jgi:predicted  nucleic acid-binding Zn-ribbon protein
MAENPFYAFVHLVELDQSVDQHMLKREKLQMFIDQIAQRTRQHQHKLETLRQQAHDLRKQLHQVELEQKTLLQQEKNKRSKLNAVNTAKEYAALEHELALIMQESQAKEESIFALWEQCEAADAHVKNEEHELQQLQKKDHEEITNIEHERLKLAQEIEELHKNRSGYLHTAPEEFVARYNTMRNSLKNPVVPVVENICSACSTQLMHADLLQLRRHVILPCKACYRLLYMK